MAGMKKGWNLRAARDEDSAAVIAVIDAVYREYGDESDLEGYDRDLLALEESYRGKGGEFVVLEVDGEVVGAHATQPIDVQAGLLTFRRLYLRRTMRGCGAGRLLMDWAIDWARTHGFRRVEFWSDTRFERAHRFFERYGFVRGGMRKVEEGKLSFFEHFYAMDLEGSGPGE